MDNAFVKKLMECDFSKNNPAHKVRLKRALAEVARELTEDELRGVSAAVAPPIPKNGKDEEGKRKNR